MNSGRITNYFVASDGLIYKNHYGFYLDTTNTPEKAFYDRQGRAQNAFQRIEWYNTLTEKVAWDSSSHCW